MRELIAEALGYCTRCQPITQFYLPPTRLIHERNKPYMPLRSPQRDGRLSWPIGTTAMSKQSPQDCCVVDIAVVVIKEYDDEQRSLHLNCKSQVRMTTRLKEEARERRRFRECDWSASM